MFLVQSYLKKDIVIDSLEGINSKYALYFACCDSNNCLKYIRDYDYIEGAITIYYNQKPLLDFRHWDLVDQLWVYFLDAIYSALIEKKNVEFYFPDQTIKVKLDRISDIFFKLSIDESVYTLDLKEFSKTMISGAERFFSILINCDCESIVSMSKEQLVRIDEIRKAL